MLDFGSLIKLANILVGEINHPSGKANTFLTGLSFLCVNATLKQDWNS